MNEDKTPRDKMAKDKMAAEASGGLSRTFPMKQSLFLLTGGMLMLCYGPDLRAQPNQTERLVAPHTQMGASRQLFPSPDHLYAARITGGDAVPTFLSIYQVSGKRRLLACPRVAGADSFVWVPHHPHLLAVAADGSVDTGSKAQLSLWNGGKRLQELVPLGHKMMDGYDERELEGFDVDGVTADGRFLVYSHMTADGDFPKSPRLRLPPP